MDDPAAETPRLRLRLPRADDLDWWLAEMNQPAVTRHLGGVQDRAGVEAKFARNAAGFARDGFGFWIVEDRASGAAMGNCGMARIDNEHAPSGLFGEVHMGWSLAERHWRRGHASEAARAVLHLGFARFGLERIFAQTSPANEASWRLMEKLGMERRAALDYADPDYPPEENPTIIYGITRAQWTSITA